ncbi:hypothetical protein JKP88DRAFT_349333 [Tribonema minus]|uniref:EF-hand domain-containing protein n=1 Tax=Tribonema minus TaxID=303371 RepID=A0A835YVR8_9STRA|nr:hypothetical protein JKP88DRAFT_349333 [Tribonema minus]
MADFLNNPFVAPSSNLTEICFKIRSQLFAAHGLAGRPTGPTGVREVFRQLDKDGSGTMIKSTFEAALAQAGLYEVNSLMRAFPAPKAVVERISYPAFLQALQLPLNERRRRVVDAAFKSLDTAGKGTVPLESALAVLRSTAVTHPEVISGKLTADQVIEDFKAFFEEKHSGQVTAEAFTEYYQSLGELEPIDAVFVSILGRLWRVREQADMDELVKHLALELGEKIRERAKDNETEAESLHWAFKQVHTMDLPSGKFNKAELVRVLEHFGLYGLLHSFIYQLRDGKFNKAELVRVLEHFGLQGVDSRIVDAMWKDVKSKFDPSNLDGDNLEVSAFVDEVVPIWEKHAQFGGRCDCGVSPDYLLDEPVGYEHD